MYVVHSKLGCVCHIHNPWLAHTCSAVSSDAMYALLHTRRAIELHFTHYRVSRFTAVNEVLSQDAGCTCSGMQVAACRKPFYVPRTGDSATPPQRTRHLMCRGTPGLWALKPTGVCVEEG